MVKGSENEKGGKTGGTVSVLYPRTAGDARRLPLKVRMVVTIS